MTILEPALGKEPIEPADSNAAGAPRAPFRDLRDCAVSMSLTNVSVDDAKDLITDATRTWTSAEAAALELVLARAEFRQRMAVDDFARCEKAVAEASRSADRLRHLEGEKAKIDESVREAAEAIRRARHVAETQRLQQELVKIDQERDATVAQLGRERVENHERAVEDWKTEEPKRRREITELEAARKEIADRLDATRTRYRDLMNPFMTYTVARFLIWAGYSAIAATGAAVTYLLDKHSDHSVLSDIFSAAMTSMDGLRRIWEYPVGVAAMYLLAALASIVGAFWLIDLLMRHFYKPWKVDEKKRSDFAPTRLGLRGPIGRRTYVQTLVAIPYVYAIGLFLIFLTYRAPAGPINEQFLGYVMPTFIHSFIGSAMTLLAASIFVLYITNISEPRIRDHTVDKRSWWHAWEVGVIPAALLVAVGFAVFGTHEKQIWGGITAFMLIGSMALAYGLVYRGMFSELRFQESVLADQTRDIEALLRPPLLPQPSSVEARELARAHTAARARRQAILDLERKRSIRRLFLPTDDQDASLVSQFEVALSAIERLFGRKVQPRAEFYRDVDFEVAPGAVARRKTAEAESHRVALEIDETRKKVEPMSEAVKEFDQARQRKRDVDERVETAEKAKLELIARLSADVAAYALDFHRAYALGAGVKGIYDTVQGRTASAVKGARWRPPSGAPPHSSDSDPSAPSAPASPAKSPAPPAPATESLEVAS